MDNLINSIKKPGLVILGASGGVGQASLQLITEKRDLFTNVVLVDRVDSVIKSRFIDHKKLNYVFIEKNISDNNIEDFLYEISKKYSISIVLDVTDSNTLPILSASDSLGLTYMNCSLNSESGSMSGFVGEMQDFSKKFNKTTHILSMGMNPGIINHLIIDGVMRHGTPNSFVEVEYDSGFPKFDPGTPFIYWSKKQFLNEAVWDYGGYCGDKGEYIKLEKTAIQSLKQTREYIEPIKKLDIYPMGMLVAHDEIIAMSRILEIPGEFIYAIHPISTDRLQILSKKGKITEDDISYMNNISNPLHGSDFIALWLNYSNKKVCYYLEVDHESIKGTNATLYMVAVGVVAGLIDFIENPPIDKGVLSVFELNNHAFLQIVSRYIPIKKIEILK